MNYEYYKSLLKKQRFPLAYIDLDLLEKNMGGILQRADGKPVRVASKSIRSVTILKKILEYDRHFRGILSFSAAEAIFLHKMGLDDIVVAYPEINLDTIEGVVQCLHSGATICLMVDDPYHIELLEYVGTKTTTAIPVCIDIDVSVDFPGLHFGVWRSSLRDKASLDALLDKIESTNYIRIDGVMGYEAEIAGVADAISGKRVANTVIRTLKKISMPRIREKRAMAVDLIKKRGHKLQFVNGGGTGSLESTTKDPSVTEVTAGSGFYQSHLFDNYSAFSAYPAAGFACAINRRPAKGIYTCAGGGYIASGSIEPIKAPLPYLPEGVRLTKTEGAGEVQTPILYDGKVPLNIGDPIFFRHSKAGELCERFNELILIKNNAIEDIVTTYRGDVQCFL